MPVSPLELSQPLEPRMAATLMRDFILKLERADSFLTLKKMVPSLMFNSV